MQTPVERIKEKLSITDVVGGYIKLEKSGLYYKARCPFHTEKSASFFVSPGRNSFHCFGCGKGGDIFTFVEEIEGIDFSETLKILAERAHVPLSEYKGVTEQVQKNKRLLALLADATAFFVDTLRESPEVSAYLLGRGLTQDTIDAFQVGFAPAYGNTVSANLIQKGYTDEELKATGMTAMSDRGTYDRFRSRIMFPIRDSQGRVVAFSGRIFPSTSVGTSSDVAKYVNSPETSLYSKSKILFGYDMAKQALLREDYCLVVEGQMDLIMAHQAGTKNTVAVSGTAFTKEQLDLIRRFTQNVALSFDADKAGVQAARRSIELALTEGMDVTMIRIGRGKDPADLIKEDPELWRTAIANRMHVVDFFLENVLAEHADERTVIKRIRDEVLPYVARVRSPLERGHFIAKIANSAGLKESDIRDEVSRVPIASVPPKIEPITKSSGESPPVTDLTEERLLSYFLLGKTVYQGKEEYEYSCREYERITGKDPNTVTDALEQSIRERMLFIAEATFGESGEHKKELTELLSLFESKLLSKQLEDAMRELRKAEANKDDGGVAHHLQAIATISKQLETIKSNRFS